MIDQPISFRKIEEMLGVSKSTANDIFRHAVKNATAKRKEQQSSASSSAPSTQSGAPEERNAEERARDAQRWEQEWEEKKGKECGKDSAPDDKDSTPGKDSAPDDKDPTPGKDSAPDKLVDGLQRLHLREPEPSTVLKNKKPSARPTATGNPLAPPDMALVPCAEFDLRELLSADVLNPNKRSGRPEVLTEEEKDRLVATVKRDFKTRRMRLVDLRREAGLSHVSDQTVLNALHERKLKAYREEFKFILTENNKKIRLVYCRARQHWEADKEWANCGFTDEMAIEVGGTFGICLVWRDQSEQWQDDCVGAKKKQGPSVMCWGFIMWNYKGPFYVWDPETKEEREAAAIEIPKLNAEYEAEEKQRNDQWKASKEWEELRERELKEAREIRAAAIAKGEKPPKTTQTWRGKKHKIEKVKRGKGRGIDSWRYVQHVCRPVLWPECKRLAEENSNFILMEDGAASHRSGYTTQERVNEGIRKMDWPPNSPDFNPIERIWALMKRRIQTRRGSERITTVKAMKKVLQEEWDKITIEEINNEIAKLPTIMRRCIEVNGGNKFHA
jgi:transposase